MINDEQQRSCVFRGFRVFRAFHVVLENFLIFSFLFLR